MIITYQENSNFQPTPEYNGIAKIVDTTELAAYKSEFGTKEQFRFILEINERRENGKYWTVATKPMTPSFHEKASLRKFVEKILDRPMTKTELKSGYDTDSLIGKYCNIIVEHVKSADGQKTFSNIVFVGKAKSNVNWQSDYIPLAERDSLEKDLVAEEAEAELIAGKV